MMSRAFKDGFIIESPTPPWELVYGGVKTDIQGIGYALSDFPKETIKIPFLILDLPFSFCADTVLLPMTLTAALEHDRQAAEDEKGPESPHPVSEN
jgi:uncharacterized protein YceK